MTEHVCEGQPEHVLIAHPWRYDDAHQAWVRDDCVEHGVAMAAIVARTLDGLKWCGPASGPYGSGPFHDTAEEAKQAYDQALLSRGWVLIESMTPRPV